MGGDIKVTSKVNEGSIFTFDIKLCLAEEMDYQGKTPKNREVIALQPDQPHYRILIAEDVEENRLLLIKLLSPIGVKYCYREDVSFFCDSGTENFVLTRESFQVMPQDWIKKLNQSAWESDEDLIIDLIEDIPETNQNLAEILTQLVENYRLDLLFNLTK